MKLSTGVLSGHEDVNFIVRMHASAVDSADFHQIVQLGLQPGGVQPVEQSAFQLCSLLSIFQIYREQVYQHTSPISPGSSGGPLFLANTDKASSADPQIPIARLKSIFESFYSEPEVLMSTHDNLIREKAQRRYGNDSPLLDEP